MAKMELDTAEVKAEEKPETSLEEEEKMTDKKKKKKKKKTEKVHVKIEQLHEQENKIAPLVGYFPSGFDPLTDQEKPEPQLTARIFMHQRRTNRMQLVVSPNNGSRVNFVGTSYAGEGTAPQLCNYALGVLDKQSQTLKIVPVATNKIFRLEPRVGVEEPSKEEKKGLDRDMYSTKQAIRQAKKRESLNRKEDPKTQEDLDRKIEGIKINQEALESAGSHSARNIPPHDSTATTPQMAYPLDKIILKGEWDYLVDILELLQVGAEVASDAYASFVCNRVPRLEAMKDEAEKKQLACVFSYINHLIKFKDKNSLDDFSSAKHHKIPSILAQKFSTMFSVPSTKRLPVEKRDLLISHVLVLTLIADGFRTELSDIARDLKMTTISLRPHYEYLGCKLVRERTLLLATLPVPLQFPKPRGKRKR